MKKGRRKWKKREFPAEQKKCSEAKQHRRIREPDVMHKRNLSPATLSETFEREPRKDKLGISVDVGTARPPEGRYWSDFF